MKLAELPSNVQIHKKYGAVYQPARALKTISGTPIGTVFLAMIATPLYDEKCQKIPHEFKPVVMEKPLHSTLGRPLYGSTSESVFTVYYGAYELIYPLNKS